jgi:transposase-like protein
MRKKYSAEQREKLIMEVRATGARVVDVARRMGVTPSAAYVWLKRSSAAAPAAGAPVFARVLPTQPSSAGRLVLEVGTIKLHVGADFDAALLRQVLEALGAVT